MRTLVSGNTWWAEELGSVDLANCTPALDFVVSTAPKGAGQCTQIARAADNPGYDTSATPAPPLKTIIASVGGGC